MTSKFGMKRRAKLAKASETPDRATLVAMSNPMRIQILTILNERANSVIGTARELGIESNEIAHDFKVLKELGRIEIVDEQKRRGATEIFYKAVAQAKLDATEWPAIPESIKYAMRASLFRDISDDAVAAIEEETFDSLEDAHMSWTPQIVDEQGWMELTEILRVALVGVERVRDESAERLAAKDTPGVSCTVSMLGYRAAIEDREVGPLSTTKDLAASSSGSKSVKRKAKAKSRAKAAKKEKPAKRSSKRKAPDGIS